MFALGLQVPGDAIDALPSGRAERAYFCAGGVGDRDCGGLARIVTDPVVDDRALRSVLGAEDAAARTIGARAVQARPRRQHLEDSDLLVADRRQLGEETGVVEDPDAAAVRA